MMSHTGQLLIRQTHYLQNHIYFLATFRWNAATAALTPRLILNSLELIGDCHIVNVNLDVRIQSENKQF